ncbi:MAG: ATP synthase F1 subunit epsilon [Phycisphaerales bacterium]|nr:MAG: ATP synthase F1 subunit epsilon [Phycisphaerales bacterium]
MAAKSFTCRVVTPSKKLFEGELEYASVPAWDGLFGVLPNRAPILARLGVGPLELRVADTDKGKGGDRGFFIRGGFVKMAANELTVLAEQAVEAERLVEQEARAELAEAEARKVPEGATDRMGEQAKLTEDVRAARAKLAMAERYRGKAI